MMKNPCFALTVLACFLTQLTFSQPICGFDAIHNRLLNTDPAYRKQFEGTESRIQAIIKEQEARKASQPAARVDGTLSTLYTIPVVVHVITTGGAIGTTYNPTDAQINGAISYLNSVYNGTYAGTEGVGDLQVQFVLATRDPNCNATTGIERIDWSGNATYVAKGINANNTDGVNDITLKNATRWNPSSYYNIWVVDKIDSKDGTSGQFIAGFAYFAGSDPSHDGVIMLATQMISGQKTLPHEIGHALNLYHPFQGSPDAATCPANTSCSTQGDMVCDTDPITYNQTGGVVDFTCRTGTNSCTGTAYSINTEHNYMNYTSCYTLFTAGQKTRMLAAMSLPDRASLVNSWADASSYPLASFSSPASTCASTTANPATYATGLLGVTIDNRTISSGKTNEDGGYVDKTGQCSSLLYLQQSGTYTITATVLGANNEQVAAWLDYNNDGAYSASEQILPTTDNIASAGGVYPYPTASHSFTIPAGITTNTVLRLRVIEELSSVYFGNSITSGCYSPAYGQTEDFPVYIAASALPLTLEYFKGETQGSVNHVSWKTSMETNTDKFEVERSYNGSAYETIGSVDATGLSTGSTYSFDDKTATGNIAYYRLKEIDITGPSKFSSVVTLKKSTGGDPSVAILNNPFTDNFSVSVTTPVQSKVVINMLDVTGKLIYTKTTESLSSAVINVQPDNRKLAAGMYLVQVFINGKTITKKVIKE